MFPPAIDEGAPAPLFTGEAPDVAPPSWIKPRVAAPPAPSVPPPPPAPFDDAEAAAAEAALYAQATQTALPPLTPPAPSVEVRDDRSAEVEALQEQLSSALEEVDGFRQRVLEGSEREIVELALAIAERVVGRELTTDPSLVMAWARQGIDALADDEPVEAVVSPDVAASIEAAGGLDGLRVVAEEGLPAATCQLRSAHGEADAGLAARLAAVREALGVED